jgi:hypothetical protein
VMYYRDYVLQLLAQNTMYHFLDKLRGQYALYRHTTE